MADITYERRIGDRREGRRIRTLAPMENLKPFIMRERSDACFSFTDPIDVTELDHWLHDKRAQGLRSISLIHAVIAAYVRTCSQCPWLNRFVSGQRIFSRRGIQVVVHISRDSADDTQDVSVKIDFEPTDTIFDVYRKMSAQIDDVKASNGISPAEEIASSLAGLPRPALRCVVAVMRMLDYFDRLPRNVLESSPFHGSLAISDAVTTGMPPIYNHICDFGNLPVFFSLGPRRRAIEPDRQGRLIERRYADLCAVMDERICGQAYFAAAYKHIRYFLRNPQLLELAPESVREDVF